MKSEDIIKVAAIGFLALVVAPVVVNVAATSAGFIVDMGNTLYSKMKFNIEMKKGLKDGSIAKIDGMYYRVKDDVEKA